MADVLRNLFEGLISLTWINVPFPNHALGRLVHSESKGDAATIPACLRLTNMPRSDAMTMTQACILAWAAVGLIVVVGLLRFLRPGDERTRQTRN